MSAKKKSEVLDLVDAMMSHAVDYVDRIHGSGHSKSCEYRPSVTSSGLIYCDTCGSQIGCIHPQCEPFMDLRRGVDLYGPGVKNPKEEFLV